MKIFIQARKDGYNILYPTPTPNEFYYFASDIQSASANNNVAYYGKMFYTLAFTSDGCVFTKYVIGYDVQRGGLGNVGISIYIPKTKKLSGENVKNLLDELIKKYCEEYCPDNKIRNTREDWNLFTKIVDQYENNLVRSSNNKVATGGSKDPAVVYYNTDNKLKEYLDKPFQEEYSDYKQIFFIDSNLKDTSSNPLNALKNSGIEVEPDLEKYSFTFYSDDFRVNEERFQLGENLINKNSKVVIEYKKKYYKPIKVEGSTISDKELRKYLNIDDDNNKITIKESLFKQEQEPEPEEKIITFVVQSNSKEPVKDAIITTDATGSKKTATDNKITFKGDEIGKEWRVTATSGDSLGEITFSPNQKNQITITVTERKRIKICVTDSSGNSIYGFKVWTKLTSDYVKRDTIEFVDEQITDSYIVKVNKEGFKEKIVSDFSPVDNTKITVTLNKKAPSLKNSFVDKNLQNSQEEASTLGTKKIKSTSFFSKTIVKATLILALFVAIIGFISLYNLWNNEEIVLKKETIITYVEGDSLMLDKLQNYQKQWKQQEPSFITKLDGGLFGGDENVDSIQWKNVWNLTNKSIDIAITKRELIDSKDFAKLLEQKYSNKQKPFKRFIEKIDSTKYGEISQELGDVSIYTLTQVVDSIKVILSPKEGQEGNGKSTETELQNIKEEKTKVQKEEPTDITNYLKTKRKFDLTTITNYYTKRKGLSTDLNKSLLLVKKFMENDYKKCKDFQKKALKHKFLKDNQNIKNWINTVCKDGQKLTNNQTLKSDKNKTTNAKTDKIIEYIKGNSLTKKKLTEYLNTDGLTQNLKKSIKLCLDFWELNGTGIGKKSKSYWSFRKKIKNDRNLKNSKLKTFLEKACKNNNNIGYSDSDKIKGLKKIK